MQIAVYIGIILKKTHSVKGVLMVGSHDYHTTNIQNITLLSLFFTLKINASIYNYINHRKSEKKTVFKNNNPTLYGYSSINQFNPFGLEFA